MSSATSLRGNLPAEFTTFVGRRRQLQEMKAALSAARLVTLVGPGGVGKTRLALRSAADLQRGIPDGVWLVELAGLVDHVVECTGLDRELAEAQTVSVVLSQFSRQGWVINQRGLIEITNRVAPEGASCECYEVIREEFARLVGPPLPRAREARAAANSL